MIEELQLSPLGYLVLLVVSAILVYFIMTAPSKADTEKTVEDSKDAAETPEYLSRYGAVIQMQGR